MGQTWEFLASTRPQGFSSSSRFEKADDAGVGARRLHVAANVMQSVLSSLRGFTPVPLNLLLLCEH
eukprot:3416762-Amphidinium_carterae.2